MRTIAQAREGKCVSVTFRGQLPSEPAVHEIRRRAALLRRADTVHAVVRIEGGHVEVSLEATHGQHCMRSTAHDDELLTAIAKAFDKLLVGEMGLASTITLQMAAGSVA